MDLTLASRQWTTSTIERIITHARERLLLLLPTLQLVLVLLLRSIAWVFIKHATLSRWEWQQVQ